MNVNCLEGIVCPNCKSLGPFSIVAQAVFVVTDDGTEEYSEVEWSDQSHIRCVDCNRDGTVGEFKRLAKRLYG